jgi:hypothetical protein
MESPFNRPDEETSSGASQAAENAMGLDPRSSKLMDRTQTAKDDSQSCRSSPADPSIMK